MSELISLGQAKQNLPSTADDVIVSNLIPACSAIVENFCNRTFALQAYDELHHGTDTGSLMVANPPIVSVSAVRTSPIPAMWLQNNDGTNMTATAQVLNGSFTLTTIKNAVTTTQSFAFNTYPAISQLVTAINAYGHNWVANLSNQFATWSSADLTANIGAFGCRQLSAPFIVHWLYMNYFQVNASLGEIFLDSHFYENYQSWRVQYTGGFAQIPPEIQQATIELVQNAYASRKWTPGMTSESLGAYSYTKDSTTAASNAFAMLSITAKRALEYWRLPTVSRYIAI